MDKMDNKNLSCQTENFQAIIEPRTALGFGFDDMRFQIIFILYQYDSKTSLAKLETT